MIEKVFFGNKTNVVRGKEKERSEFKQRTLGPACNFLHTEKYLLLWQDCICYDKTDHGKCFIDMFLLNRASINLLAEMSE